MNIMIIRIHKSDGANFVEGVRLGQPHNLLCPLIYIRTIEL